ncbi:hypothetical protein [Acinetobacter sp. 25977_3]|uniref:hypothetical protein n=1 Tax=Acinetobacter sp. 25977_3 TaxID=1310907 RepID=UPI0004466E54|nr:hypothetical protein [Acinetobacter sp. 25977_3]EXT58168.1 hypothetical protein J806_0136 [Acinetobacter sp. 25977_3]
MRKQIPIKITAFIILIICSVVAYAGLFKNHGQPPIIEGIFWQPDNNTTPPKGNWHYLGVNTFVPQWSVVESKSWWKNSNLPQWENAIDIQKIKQQPWAKNLILGLAGEYNEHEARANVVALGEKSAQIIQEQNDASLKGYYFPVEADPTWLRVSTLGHVLEKLPSPVWVSVYSGETEPENYDLWVKSWLPQQAGIFFQDGVGVGVRTPQQARRILDQLEQTLGKDKTVIVLEAFRTKKNGQFRAAYPWEIISQIKAYEGKTIYIFDGPHYMGRWSVYIVGLWYRLPFGSTSTAINESELQNK